VSAATVSAAVVTKANELVTVRNGRESRMTADITVSLPRHLWLAGWVFVLLLTGSVNAFDGASSKLTHNSDQ
jgi:hypothetical protein